MEFGTIPGVEKPVSRLMQGTLMVKRGGTPDVDLLDAIFGMGCNTFDTAHVYGQGENERTVGEWVNARGIREQLVIIGKGAHPNADRKRVYPFDISSDLYDSLARFRFDYIDLYLLHRDDPSVPVGEIVDVLNEHQRAGRIRAFGGSNWSHERLQAANDYAAAHGLTPFVASSPNYSLAEQVREPWAGCISIGGPNNEAARAWYTRTQMPIISWSSLAGGFFSGRFRRDNLDTFTDYFGKVCVESYCYEENFRRLDRAQRLADEMGHSVAQIAMAFILNQPLNVFALTGCNTLEEFRANLDALNIRLDEATLDWLDLRRDER
jgi:aryl-alcohol dehydrogenase-like predicted oxidoreductase